MGLHKGERIARPLKDRAPSLSIKESLTVPKPLPDERKGLITGAQCRKARIWLGWTDNYLALISGVSNATIWKFESGNYTKPTDPRVANGRTARHVRAALESGGLIFLEDVPFHKDRVMEVKTGNLIGTPKIVGKKWVYPVEARV